MLNRIKKREKCLKRKLLIVGTACMLCLSACGTDKDVEADEERTEFVTDSESEQDDSISDIVEQDSNNEEEITEQNPTEEEDVTEQNSTEETEETDDNIVRDVTGAYNDFISKGTYNQYTQNWDTMAEEYCVLDINNDGIPELFINSANMGPGWYTTLIFTYNADTSEVVLVSDEYNYGGIRYSPKHNAVLYTDTKPSIMCGGVNFYELQGTELVSKFFVGHDTDENGTYYFYSDETASTNITEDENNEYFQNLVEIEYIKLPVNPQMSSKTETELLAIMQSKIGFDVENHIYTDMDHDGVNELIGTYCKDGYYQTWYCSSDGEVCELVHENDSLMEYSQIETLDVESETHVVVNAYMSMGTNKNYSIFMLRDKKIIPVVSNQYGGVYMTDNGDIALSIEAYDGFYDPGVDSLMVHTWKNTYLFFDGTTYKEYGAIELFEKEFLVFENAEVIKEKIDSQMRGENTALLEYKFFKRSNGIMHIQCNVHNDIGEIQYGYYTVRYSDNVLEEEIGEYNQGQMEAHFSGLEVVY